MSDPEPDYAYDKNDWEYTVEWRDREVLTDYLDFSHGVMEIGTLQKGPSLYAAVVPVTFDDNGDPDETEVRWFDTREEVDAALAEWKARGQS